MNELEKSYLSDRLTPEELPLLRRHLNEASDEQLDETLAEVWNSDIDDTTVPAEQLARMRNRLDQALSPVGQLKEGDTEDKRPHRSYAQIIALKWFKVAASLLLLILMVTTAYLFHERSAHADDVVAFATTKGERATVTLPDGTKVTLSYDSRLTYHPMTYNRHSREVHFVGEAWFDVAKNKHCPFIIENQQLKVQVLGTKFNLSTRHTDQASTLALSEGKVRITATSSGIDKEILPGEVAVLDPLTGKISVSSADNIDDYWAWQQNEIVFADKKFVEVIKTLEDIYNVRFIIKTKKKTDGFNGTLPTNDLPQALNILRSVYGFTYSTEGNKITIVY